MLDKFLSLFGHSDMRTGKFMNLKCSHCGIWSNDVPLSNIIYEEVTPFAKTTCGYCGDDTVWFTDAPTWISKSDIEEIDNRDDL